MSNLLIFVCVCSFSASPFLLKKLGNTFQKYKVIAIGIFPLIGGGGGGGEESSKFSTHISVTAATAAYQQKLFSSVAIMIQQTTNSGESKQNIKGALKKFKGGSDLFGTRKVLRRAILSHKVRLTLYSYLVSLCPVSDLFGKRELILDKEYAQLNISSLCQINQILDKFQMKQLLYHSCPNFSHVPLTIIRSNKSIMHNGPYSNFSNFV